jgi:hypothetical protein
MEAMVGISLYSYPYAKLAKTLCVSYSCLRLLQQNWKRGQNRFYLEVRRIAGRDGTGGRRRNDPNNVCIYE